MIRDVTFENSEISSVIIENPLPLDIKISDPTTALSQISISPKGDNEDKRLIILSGDYKNSDIKITSSCTLQGDTDFVASNPIKLISNDVSSLIIFGHFSLSSGISVESPWNIISSNRKILEGLDVAVDLPLPGALSFVGNFLYTNVEVKSPCDINWNGFLKFLSVDPNLSYVNIFLLPESSIDVAVINSPVYASGDSLAIYLLTINTIVGVDKIVPNPNLYTLSLTNGMSNLSFSFSDVGNYKVSTYLISEEKEIKIGDSFILNVSNP